MRIFASQKNVRSGMGIYVYNKTIDNGEWGELILGTIVLLYTYIFIVYIYIYSYIYIYIYACVYTFYIHIMWFIHIPYINVYTYYMINGFW
jgi:hypothetical protein